MEANVSVGIFESIAFIIESLLNNIQQMSLDSKMQQLQLLISAIITLTIMYKGYMVLAGKSQDPIRELVWDLGRKAFILSFAMGAGLWLNYSVEAVKGVYEWAGGGIGFYTKLDKLVNSVLSACKDILDLGGWTEGADNLFYLLIAAVIILAFVAISIELFFSIIACSVSNTFLIIVLPLALFCLMWNQTKQVFTQWCQLVLSNTFTLLFLFLFVDFAGQHMSKIFTLNISKSSNLFLELLTVILMSFILVQIIKVIKSLAQNLAQVSLDSAMSGVGASQVAGAVFGGSTKNMGKAAMGGVGGMTGQSVSSALKQGGLAGLAGNLAGKSMGSGALKAANMGKAILSKMRETRG